MYNQYIFALILMTKKGSIALLWKLNLITTFFASSFSVTLSHTGLTAQQTTDNVLAVVNHMVRVIPGGKTERRTRWRKLLTLFH